MTLAFQQRASIILETLISLTIGITICGYILHNHLVTIKVYYKMWHQYKTQHTKLVARHYIGQDLATMTAPPATYTSDSSICRHLLPHLNWRQLKPASSILQLTTSQGDIVWYYLRKSIIQNQQKKPSYALYRDDLVHKAVAIVENVSDLYIKIMPHSQDNQVIRIKLLLNLQEELNIAWYFRNNN